MNFLADESIDRQIVDALREDDHAVLYVTEMNYFQRKEKYQVRSLEYKC